MLLVSVITATVDGAMALVGGTNGCAEANRRGAEAQMRKRQKKKRGLAGE